MGKTGTCPCCGVKWWQGIIILTMAQWAGCTTVPGTNEHEIEKPLEGEDGKKLEVLVKST